MRRGYGNTPHIQGLSVIRDTSGTLALMDELPPRIRLFLDTFPMLQDPEQVLEAIREGYSFEQIETMMKQGLERHLTTTSHETWGIDYPNVKPLYATPQKKGRRHAYRR